MEIKKKALGRGLEQLFNNEGLDFESFESNIVESTPSSEIREISLKELRSNPYQPRKNFDEEALNELTESIKEYGVFQPIIVKKSIKGYEIVAGERRVKASIRAGLETIPAIIRDFTDQEMMEIALLENLQRENLSAIEEAWAYRNLIESLHITQEDLAIKLGKSRSHITNMLGLLRLPEEIQNMVLHNQISMGHARVLSKLSDDDLIKDYANKVIKDNLSVRDLENITNNNQTKKKVFIKRRVAEDADYHFVENELRELLGTKVKIGNKKIEINFDSTNDLNRILEIMNIKID